MNLNLISSLQENSIAATQALLRKLNIPVTTAAIVQSMTEHPDYPSLLTISDAFSQWNIDHISMRVEKEKIDELDPPFIAYLQDKGRRFTTVFIITDQEIVCSDYANPQKRQTKSRKDFLEAWNGVVLLAERSDRSGEKDYRARAREEFLQRWTIPFVVAGCLLMVICPFLLSPLPVGLPAVWPLLLTLLTLGGAMVTGLLLWYEVDQADPFFRPICTIGKKTNCKSILQSRAARLFGLISWSEIGFFYFAGSFIYLVITPTYLQATNALAWLNAFAMPYVIFSLYYQWRVAKQWCPLCLVVQGVLAGELIVFFLLFWSRPIPHPVHFPFTIIPAFLMPVLFWAFTKSFLLRAVAGDRYKTELNRIRQNKQVFNTLLQKQKAIVTQPAGLGIFLGNPEAANTIIKVCSPYCGPCAKAHPKLEKLLRETDGIKAQIIFMATDNEKDRRSSPVKHLLAIQEKNDHPLLEQALDDWYRPTKKDYPAFAQKYPIDGELREQDEKVRAMKAWCNATGISATPTFFVNGYQLPEIYDIKDLEYFLST